jgi:hypothetical protein
MAQYGDFPGIRVTTESGGISSVSVGAEEKVVLFGEANYDGSNNVDGDDANFSVSASEPEQINAPRVAGDKFGSGSELADGMREALANGANIDYLYGVAVPRVDVSGESQSSQDGTLDNAELVDERSHVTFDDGGTILDVEFRYDGNPVEPGATDTVYINPLTGEYHADSTPSSSFSIDYTYNDYATAFSASAVRNVVNEDETGVYFALSDSDSVSSSLNTEVSTLRNNYQLVTGMTIAEPNDNEIIEDANTTDANAGADARYDASTYSSANQSIVEEHFFKFAPGREEDVTKTIGGGIAGLFAGSPIDEPVYNDAVSGYSSLEQAITKTDEDNLRAEDIIPVREGGAIRVKGNRSTAYGESDTVAATFWTRRIADRVTLIAKLVGDNILGRINDPQTRRDAERQISSNMRQLADQRLIRQNTADDLYWKVDVYEDENNENQANVDISFTPYGIVKEVDATVTVNTS